MNERFMIIFIVALVGTLTLATYPGVMGFIGMGIVFLVSLVVALLGE